MEQLTLEDMRASHLAKAGEDAGKVVELVRGGTHPMVVELEETLSPVLIRLASCWTGVGMPLFILLVYSHHASPAKS